jgi:nitroimidazol reductase NimA-like FMN-containing flavoprotein (pyridoxamine 5'-phosphate oxidase superfamily)
MAADTWLAHIRREECEELLASSTFGRVGVIVDGHPEIFPVVHVYDRDRGCVAFPTNPGTKLYGALDWPFVGYEVDGVDADGASGWSVLVVGRAEEVSDPGEIAKLAAQRNTLWRSGGQLHWLRIVPSKVTGRRIGATTA